MDPDLVVGSLDGIGAFDHVKRAAFMRKLMDTPSLRDIVPLVRMLYGSESCFLWTDDDGVTHIITQAEGGEQGCPLMPALYALAQHDALVAASRELLPSERLYSFLDDLYVVTSRERFHEAFKTVAENVERHAGVKSHLGKLRAWCSGGGAAPAAVAALGEEVWTADNPPQQNGLVILGTPLGTPAFVQEHAEKRMEKERHLLGEITKLPTL